MDPLTQALRMPPCVDGVPRVKQLLAALKAMPQDRLDLALTALQDHLDAFPEDELAWTMRTRLLSQCGNTAEAMETVQTMIARFAGTDLDSLIEEIASHLPDDVRLLDSRVLPMAASGSEHLGFLLHDLQVRGTSRKAVTKIALCSQAGAEFAFYSSIPALSPEFAQAIPPIYGLFRTSNLRCVCITMEWIEGRSIQLESMSDDEIVQLLRLRQPLDRIHPSASLAAFQPQELKLILGQKRMAPLLGLGHLPGNLQVIGDWLAGIVANRDYQQGLATEIRRTLQRVTASGLSNRLVPARHYRLNHGDFYHNNILTAGLNQYRFIDWSSAVMSVRGADLALLLRRLPYERILSLLESADITRDFDGIDWAFFHYALIAASIMIDIPQIIHEDPDKLFIPALQALTRAL